jgi:hypothetical protein
VGQRGVYLVSTLSTHFGNAAVNHIYRTVWNEAQQAWVAVAETVTGRGKSHSLSTGARASSTAPAPAVVVLTLCIGLGLASKAWSLDTAALPTGGRVVAGAASISQSGNTLTVQQNSNRAALDWQSFNVGSAARVNFVQPSSRPAAQ